jgi:SAM-dependent methyltransferase
MPADICSSMATDTLPTLLDDELDLLEALVPLQGLRVIELGCGPARLARALLLRHADAEVTALDVDDRQLAKNRLAPQDRLTFVRAGAERIPLPDARFDLALMLKSLHHVPVDQMDVALREAARVVRPGGWLYVSEPVYAGPLNELVRLFNDEGTVRAAAQQALDRALRDGLWAGAAEHRFDSPVSFRDFDDFESRMMRPTFADHRIDDALCARVRSAFEPHLGRDGRSGAHFLRPMHVRLLRRTHASAAH